MGWPVSARLVADTVPSVCLSPDITYPVWLAPGRVHTASGPCRSSCAAPRILESDRHVEFRRRRTTSHRSHYATRSPTMRYACLIYFDPRKVFDQSPEGEAVLRAVGPHDSELKASGHLVSAIALQLPATATTVQGRDGEISATDGPFMHTNHALAAPVLIHAPHLPHTT